MLQEKLQLLDEMVNALREAKKMTIEQELEEVIAGCHKEILDLKAELAKSQQSEEESRKLLKDALSTIKDLRRELRRGRNL